MLVRNNIKKLKVHAEGIWSFLSVYSSFYNRHKSIYQNPEFESSELTLSEKKYYLNYWKAISPHISLKTVEISKSLSGKFDKHIVPEEIFPLYIEPHLNSDMNIGFLENKSFYNKWFDYGIFPQDYFHKIDGHYYDSNLEQIQDINEFINEYIKESNFPLIVKPNKDSYGGANINSVNNKEELIYILSQHSDLVIQEKLEQSELLNKFNPESINSVRVCLYRDRTGKFNVINTSLRMGKDGSLDNETAGGIVCNIKSSGYMNEYAVDKYALKYFTHPNSGVAFKNKLFPMYQELLDASIDIANHVLSARLVSLDMALDSSNKWRCIEINLKGQTIRFAQYAGEPFFGDFTDEIIELLKS